MSFSRANGLALHKKTKHSRPDKVSVCKIHGVITDDVGWRTGANDGAIGVASRVEASNNH